MCFDRQDCYSYQDLNATVAKVNSILDDFNVSMVIVGGDITSSAQPTQFVQARRLLDKLAVPYLPVMGNHDIWSYNEVTGDETDTPVGDALFGATFADVFDRFKARGGFIYPNASVHNPQHNCTSTFQNWELQGSAMPGNSDDLAPLLFIAPDFNTRQKAPPPCPGHSPIGGCGVPGVAALNNFSGGVFPWFESRLDALPTNGQANRSVFWIIHQPFRCEFFVPDWYFCFNKKQKAGIRAVVDARPPSVRASLWGELAGHQHRWWSGTAFDEPGWEHFAQLENSAVKGDAKDHRMASSFQVFVVETGTVVETVRFWTEGGVWQTNHTDAGIN